MIKEKKGMEEKLISFNEQFRKRTKKFALDLCKFLEKIPQKEVTRNLIRQNIRSGTSVAANFRAACRARSDAEYYSKLCIVVEECDETIFWLELLEELTPLDEREIKELLKESNELLGVFATTKKKLRNKLYKEK
jgi:four helix bundle protein